MKETQERKIKIMTNFTKSDLVNKYNWSTDKGDNPKLKGEPDKSLLDRTEGYEVLYMIQKIMKEQGWKQIATGQKIEGKIKDAPNNVHSQEHIKKCVLDNWN